MKVIMKKMKKNKSLIIATSYILFTYILFWSNLWKWPVDNWLITTLFMSLFLIAFVTGGVFGNYSRIGVIENREIFLKKLYIFSLSVTTLLIIPTIYSRAGYLEFNILKLMSNQGEVYTKFSVNRTTKTIKEIEFLRIIFSFVLFYYIPYFIINFKKINIIEKITSVFNIILSAYISFLRGTDREIFEMGFYIFVFYMASNVRENKKLNIKKKILIIISIIFLIGAFIERRDSRYSGNYVWNNPIDKNILFDKENIILGGMSDKMKFGISQIVSYGSQGYYGLSLALKEDFKSSYGLGHTPVYFGILKGNLMMEELYKDTYIYRIKKYNWDDKVCWSSLYTWIANDISFFGVIVFMFAIGFLFQMTWREYLLKNSLFSIILFSQIGYLILFIPANNQLGIMPESISKIFFSFVFWFLSKYKLRRKVKK